MLTGLAEPGRRALRISRRARRRFAPPRLRPRRPLEAAERERVAPPDAIVITHFHLDHWGDLVPWVWGALPRPGASHRSQSSGFPPAARSRLEQFGTSLGFADMFERVFAVHEYTPEVEFVAGGCTVTATVVPHYRVEAHALRVTADERTLAYSGDSARPTSSSRPHVRRISSSARRRSTPTTATACPRPSLAGRGSLGVRGIGGGGSRCDPSPGRARDARRAQARAGRRDLHDLSRGPAPR